MIDLPWLHERWDGTGYPDRLAGDAIPLGARIFTIVNVWDALTSVRPYKEAWSRDAARDEILRASARQFDPELSRLFLDLESALPAGDPWPEGDRA